MIIALTLSFKRISFFNVYTQYINLKTTKFVSNVLEAINKLKSKNSKNHFSILVSK